MRPRAEWLLAISCICIVALSVPWLLDPGTPLGDDNSAHFAAAVHVAEVLRAGESDFWWHQSNLGVPMFAAYQPLPTLGMGAIIALFGGFISEVFLFKLSLILCWALMPLAWFQGSRWYGLPTLFCVILGLLTLTIHDPQSIGFGIRSSTIRGLYTQHFGLLFLPLFIGSFKTLIDGERPQTLSTAALFATTTMCHLWVGLYAVIVALTLALCQPMKTRANGFRLLVFSGLSFLLLAWWIVPLLLTNEYAGGLPWLRETHNGWPWSKTVRMMASGAIFDTSRIPLLSLGVGLGSLMLLRFWRKKAVQHWILLTAVTGFLFLGRTNLGELYNLLPLHEQVNVMRYITGVHICGLIAASMAIWSLLHWLTDKRQRVGRIATMVVGLVLVISSANDIQSTLRSFQPNEANFASLTRYLNKQPDHRIAVHKALDTGNHFYRDLLPLLSNRGQLQSYAHGFHCTLSTYYAEYFDFSPVACDLFGVGSIVAKSPVPSSFPLEAYPRIWRNNRYAVFHPRSIPQAGLFSFVHVHGAIEGPNFRALRPAVKALTVASYKTGSLPKLNANSKFTTVGIRTPSQWFQPWDASQIHTRLKQLTSEPSPAFTGQIRNVQRGLASYTVDVDVPEQETPWLLLKTNMFPWWQASVDTKTVPIEHVAPNFMAIQLQPGQHHIAFVYKNPKLQKAGAFLSFAVLIGVLVAAVRRRYRMLVKD